MSMLHGGPDALGAPLHDFSTNGNACGPCPQVLAALQACDPRHYPDPAYTALRQQLADFHGVDTWRIVLAGSASEFIFRITAWVARGGARTVSVPLHAYGDYAMAAQAWGLEVVHQPGGAALAWACEPSSPLGLGQTEWTQATLMPSDSLPSVLALGAAQIPVRVLDCAYAPLRLSGAPTLSEAQRNSLWQLFTPNKALGLTGVRGAYVIAPTETTADARDAVTALDSMCPSWPLGVHAVAMLQAWAQADVQDWLAQSRDTLLDWKQRQLGVLAGLGWTCLPSEANFFVAQPFGQGQDAAAEKVVAALTHLRGHGIKLRDATSFGLPGHVRVGVLPPVAQDALAQAWNLYKDNG